MTIDDQIRALSAVKLLSAIRRFRPHLFAAIKDFARHEFPAQAAVSRKDANQENQLRRHTECADTVPVDHRGQPAACAGE